MPWESLTISWRHSDLAGVSGSEQQTGDDLFRQSLVLLSVIEA